MSTLLTILLTVVCAGWFTVIAELVIKQACGLPWNVFQKETFLGWLVLRLPYRHFAVEYTRVGDNYTDYIIVKRV